jgi:hypothetical protein
VVRRFDRRAPEGHDAVAHVLVDGAAVGADDVGEPAEDGVEQVLQLHGSIRSDILVKPRMSQNITVSSLLVAFML